MAAKKSSPARRASPPLARAIRFLLFRAEGRLALVGALLLAALAVGPFYAWRIVGPKVLAGDDYRLTPERIELVPPPESIRWIRRDVKQDVARQSRLDDGLSLLDDDLNQRLSQAFSLHPWIEKVVRVEKRYPASATVEVVYRKPAAIIAIGEDRWQPIDATGVTLPADDFSPTEARRYPQVAGVRNGPPGPTGSRWNDARVLGAAAIATALGDDWNRLKLQWIIVSDSPSAEGDYSYQLLTQWGRRIHWGRAPRQGTVAADSTARAKIASLRSYVEKNGSLDEPSDGQELDLRTPGRVMLLPQTARGPAPPGEIKERR